MNMHTKYIKRLIICCGLSLVLPLQGHAQSDSAPDEVSGKPMMLYFRFDRAVVDSGYMDNRHTLSHLDRLMADSALTARIDSINILSFASPEGSLKHNRQLAKERSLAVKGYLVWKHPHFDQRRIHPRPQGENWREFRRLIAIDKNLPYREEVLQIIDCNDDPERCKVLLKQLDGGAPYRYINRRLLRYLRNASVCMVWIKPDTLPTLPKPARPPMERLNELGCLQPAVRKEERRIMPPESKERDKGTAPQPKRPLFALKTNLLFDAAMMPNVEIEVPIGRRWSVNGEYMFPWWLFDGDKYSLQILMGGLEGRYWLGSRDVLTGHFLGLYAGGGKYDLQWKENGYQGEFFIAAGISYGYAKKIARNLRLEFNIGIGVLRTDYRHYHARDNYQTLLWQENGKYTWFGPTKAKISLVWLLNRKAKKGGAR